MENGEGRCQVVESEGQGNPQVIKAWEPADTLADTSEVFNCEKDVLKMEKHLEHQVVEAVLAKETQTLLRATDQEEYLQGNHREILSHGLLRVFDNAFYYTVKDHQCLNDQVSSCSNMLGLDPVLLRDYLFIYIATKNSRKNDNEADQSFTFGRSNLAPVVLRFVSIHHSHLYSVEVKRWD